MILEVNDKELEVLQVLIESRIAQLLPEIRRTDAPEYRKFLERDHEVLTALLDRLGQPVA
jgi:uncharacterized small protein (DUF1192 family)